MESICARFARATDGNIAVIFAIVLVPIVGLVGTAIDYSRMSKARASMLAALDSAALMVSKDVAANNTMTPAQVTAKAQGYFNALFARPDVTGVTLTASYSGSSTSTVTMTGQGSIATQFLAVIGFPSITFNTSSQTTWGMSALRVAMSLDNTGSMSDAGKMPALKTAAKNLVTTLSGLAKNPGDVYISLVPFAKDVNIGTANVTASWIDWTDWNAANYTMVCDTYYMFFCTHSSPVTKSHSLWTGCVTDRTQDYDVKNTTPTTTNSQTWFPAEEYGTYCKVGNSPYLQPILGLTYNWTLLKTNIDLMTPTGGTNQPIGLAWAWHSLSQGAPLSAPPETSGVTYNKVIIHMSDGANTQDRWPSYGNGSTQYNGAIDARQRILCDNIKAAGIRIISMQVNTDGSPTQAVMQYCASSPSDFYIVTSASQMISAFDSIGTSLTKLRIAQ